MNLNFCLPKFWVIAVVLINSWFLSGAYLKTYTSYGYEMWVNRSHQGGVQCTWTLTLGCFIFELLPFVYFHTWILSGAYLQDYTSYGYEISWMGITWGKTGVFCDNLPLLLCVCSTSFENCVGKGEIALNEQFLLFSHCFLPFWRTFCHLYRIWNCHLQTLSVWKSLRLVALGLVNFFTKQQNFRSAQINPLPDDKF